MLAEALGLMPGHLMNMGCGEGLFILGLSLVLAPMPLGLIGHTDCAVMTTLLQDHNGGLQILQENLWIDVPFLRGALTVKHADVVQTEITPEYDRKSEVQAFDEAKTGVKGLLDAGITMIPRIFVHDQQQELSTEPFLGLSQDSIPVIDLQDIAKDAARREEVISKIRGASEEWGFFQIVNHGIPASVFDKMIEGVRQFHEQDTEVKRQYYTRDLTRKVSYNCNLDLHQAPAANWRDTFYVIMAPDPPEPEELPVVCRDIIIESSELITKLGETMFELLSEALGLKPNHLMNMDCAKGLFMICHYYPPCPEPECTIGISGHTDCGFLTILLQDQVGGLQVLHENQWIDVPFLPGALIVNIADLLQITNDKFKSVRHRVLSKHEGPRISAACFFRKHFDHESTRLYGPIKELLSEDHPPHYKETTVKEAVAHISMARMEPHFYHILS